MNQLLNHGANPNALNNSKQTPLHLLVDACTYQDIFLDGIRLLVKFNADIDIQDGEGQSLLLWATESICDDSIEDEEFGTRYVHQLLKLGANPNLETVYGTTPFSTAMDRKVDLMSMMVSYGAEIDYINSFGFTLLHNAAEELNVDLVTKLLQHGADPDILDRLNESAMHKVLLSPYIENYKNAILEVTEQLVKHGANVNVQNSDGETPLHIAVGYSAEVKKVENGLEILVRVGLDPYIRNHDDRSAFEEALKLNNINATKIMLLKL